MNNIATRVGGGSFKVEFETSYYDNYLQVETLCRKLIDKRPKSFYGCCANCKWFTMEVCINNKSDWCGDFRTPDKLCECWEYKDGA